MTNLVQIFTDFFVCIHACWDSQRENTGNWNMSSAFEQHLKKKYKKLHSNITKLQ